MKSSIFSINGSVMLSKFSNEVSKFGSSMLNSKIVEPVDSSYRWRKKGINRVKMELVTNLKFASFYVFCRRFRKMNGISFHDVIASV